MFQYDQYHDTRKSKLLFPYNNLFSVITKSLVLKRYIIANEVSFTLFSNNGVVEKENRTMRFIL